MFNIRQIIDMFKADQSQTSRCWTFKKTNITSEDASQVLDEIYNAGFEILIINATIENGFLTTWLRFQYPLRKAYVRSIFERHGFPVEDLKKASFIMESAFQELVATPTKTKIQFANAEVPGRIQKNSYLGEGINHVFSVDYKSMYQEIARWENLYFSYSNSIEYMCILPVPDQHHLQIYIRFYEPQHMDNVMMSFGEIYVGYLQESDLLSQEIIDQYFVFKDTKFELIEYSAAAQ